MTLIKELRDLLRPGKIAHAYQHPDHIVLFAEYGQEAHYVSCFHDQTEMAFDFLKEKSNVEFVTIAQLGRNVFTYDKGMLQIEGGENGKDLCS